LERQGYKGWILLVLPSIVETFSGREVISNGQYIFAYAENLHYEEIGNQHVLSGDIIEVIYGCPRIINSGAVRVHLIK